MTLLTEHIEAGWREVESGEFGRWVAERLFARPGATSDTVRVEASTSGLLQQAVTLRESQLAGADKPALDVVTDDGSTVTDAQHDALKVEGVVSEAATAVESPEPAVADEEREEALREFETAVTARLQVAAEDFETKLTNASDDALARFNAAVAKLPEVTSEQNPEAEAAVPAAAGTSDEPESPLTPSGEPVTSESAAQETAQEPQPEVQPNGGAAGPQVVAPGTTDEEPVPSTEELAPADLKVIEGGAVAESGELDTETVKPITEDDEPPAAA